jgi:hypothetical protein
MRTSDPAFLSRPLRRVPAEMGDESLDPGSRRCVLDLLVQGRAKGSDDPHALRRRHCHSQGHRSARATDLLDGPRHTFCKQLNSRDSTAPTPMYRYNLLTLRLGHATADAELVPPAIVHMRRTVEICQERGRDRGMYLPNSAGHGNDVPAHRRRGTLDETVAGLSPGSWRGDARRVSRPFGPIWRTLPVLGRGEESRGGGLGGPIWVSGRSRNRLIWCDLPV